MHSISKFNYIYTSSTFKEGRISKLKLYSFLASRLRTKPHKRQVKIITIKRPLIIQNYFVSKSKANETLQPHGRLRSSKARRLVRRLSTATRTGRQAAIDCHQDGSSGGYRLPPGRAVRRLSTATRTARQAAIDCHQDGPSGGYRLPPGRPVRRLSTATRTARQAAIDCHQDGPSRGYRLPPGRRVVTLDAVSSSVALDQNGVVLPSDI